MDADLTRERGLWGPPSSSQLDKWALDMVEGNKYTQCLSSVKSKDVNIVMVTNNFTSLNVERT